MVIFRVPPDLHLIIHSPNPVLVCTCACQSQHPISHHLHHHYYGLVFGTLFVWLMFTGRGLVNIVLVLIVGMVTVSCVPVVTTVEFFAVDILEAFLRGYSGGFHGVGGSGGVHDCRESCGVNKWVGAGGFNYGVVQVVRMAVAFRSYLKTVLVLA